MLEILALIVVLLAAHKGKPRKYRRYIRGAITETVSLGTLGAGVVIAADMTEVVNERTFVSSVVATWSLGEFTPATDDGPITVGLAHSDYTAAEIEAWIENTGGWNEGNKVSQEIAKRKIKIVGTFEIETSATGINVLNDGRPIKTKLNFVLLQGQTVKIWARNDGQSALAATDPDVTVQGHANLWPQ